MVIWDEASMCHKHCFEAVERTFRDILCDANGGSHNISSGDKTILLGGDFR